ncbi:MAG: penicillin-binding protein 2 [Bacteroidetes bacterium CG2_30_33_31]|nr:MAG: penicillin-binding protein 2 [Bacteroidetes bacterium CG2_30_33_31]
MKIKDKYQDRKFVIYAFIAGIGLIIVIRLIILQLIDKNYRFLAENNSLRNITVHPPRGLVYDRNGKILVYNEAVYDLMVIPNRVKNIDTVALCKLLDIDKEGFNERMNKAIKQSCYQASLFEKQISKENAAYLREKLYKYIGFYIVPRTLRSYPKPIAAHLVGYIGEVNDRDLEKDSFYSSRDYIGISGLERTYETVLRGRKGVKKLLVDNLNREKGSFYDGKYDVEAVNGSDITLGIDMDLQEYGEKLMANKKGGLVAIDPSTGEILAIISSPTYDPNMLVGRIRSKNYNDLLKDLRKPLLNRALISSYPPGSTFKTINALIGEQEKVLFQNTLYSCNMGINFSGLHIDCHEHPSPLNLEQSISQSCNAYYCNVYRSIIENRRYKNSEQGYRKWRYYTQQMGFGKVYPTDLPYEKSGNIPSPEYYDRYYGKGHWNAITTISLAIGQGEILVTPLQLANQAAFIANRGYYFIPHIIKKIEGQKSIDARFLIKHYVGIDKQYFEPVIAGMMGVTEIGGTASSSRLDSIIICGKTGTAQNPHGKNHAVFIAFAPKDNPKIAIAVFIENSGFGGVWAAPIASLMIEQYLKGHVAEKRKPLELRMIEGNLLN